MAGKRSGSRSKSKRKSKMRKASPGARKSRKGVKSRPRARAKAKKSASSRRAPKRPAARRPASARSSGARTAAKRRAPARGALIAKSRSAAGKAAVRAPGKERARIAARGTSEPQGMLEFDEGPTATELPRENDITPPAPAPKRRRGKGSQLNMLDYPGESLTVGMQAPEFSLPSTLGRRVSLNEFRGRRVILYFYPKDDTPGCTMEACGFRDSHPRIESKDAVVLGISLDDELSHERFSQKYSLPFPLLSDKDAAVSRQYGTYKEKTLYGRSFWGIERTTFVIDREGKVEHVFRRVKVEGHAEEVMATLAL